MAHCRQDCSVSEAWRRLQARSVEKSPCASLKVPNGPPAQRAQSSGVCGPGAQMLSEVNGSLDRVRPGLQDRLLVPDRSPANLLSLAARTGWGSGHEVPQGLPLGSLQKSRLSQVPRRRSASGTTHARPRAAPSHGRLQRRGRLPCLRAAQEAGPTAGQ